MLIGQTISALEGENNETTVYTPWFPRQGDATTTTVEVIAISDDSKFTVQAQTKDSEEVDSALTDLTPVVAIADTTSPLIQSARQTAFQELARYKITLEATKTAASGASLYCHFRVLAPQWEATGAQSI